MEADEIHPDVQRILARRERVEPILMPVRSARWMRLVMRGLNWVQNRNPPAVGATTDLTIDGPGGDLPLRIYEPDAEGPHPTLVFFHGGGHVLGSLESHDLLCRHLTRETGCVVVAVDYRLAPEHPFPANVEDAYRAIEWATAHEEQLHSTGELAVIGDSAGGALAAVTSLMAAERDGPEIDYQVLIYPGINVREEQDSVQEHAGIVLDEADLGWFHDCYFGSDVHFRNPYANPTMACDVSGVPPATVITAGFDPLRDGAKAYVEKLVDDSVSVRYRNYESMVHGFITMLSGAEEVDRAHEAIAAIADDLDDAFEQPA